jgi:hypothetical protein
VFPRLLQLAASRDSVNFAELVNALMAWRIELLPLLDEALDNPRVSMRLAATETLGDLLWRHSYGTWDSNTFVSQVNKLLAKAAKDRDRRVCERAKAILSPPGMPGGGIF